MKGVEKVINFINNYILIKGEFMENKKEILKKISLVIVIILIIFVCLFTFYNEKESDDVNYNDFLEEFNNEIDTSLQTVENNINTEYEANKIKVYITGEVNNPGVKELDEGSRIEDVINIAGGLTQVANISNVNLAYEVADGQKIYIPNVNEIIKDYITEENGEGIVETSNNITSGKIDINKADVEMLCELPGVGESLASRIVTHREENGKFKSIEELKNVSGIGEKKFESLKEYIVVK